MKLLFKSNTYINDDLKKIIKYNLDNLLPNTTCDESNLVDCSGEFVNCDTVNKYLMDNMRLKECYSNAIKYIQYFYDEYKSKNIYLSYCEDVTTFRNSIVFEHAWIKVREFDKNGVAKTYFIDPTLEICCQNSIEEINSEKYIIMREYTFERCIANILKYKTYGPWYYKNQNKQSK